MIVAVAAVSCRARGSAHGIAGRKPKRTARECSGVCLFGSAERLPANRGLVARRHGRAGGRGGARDLTEGAYFCRELTVGCGLGDGCGPRSKLRTVL